MAIWRDEIYLADIWYRFRGLDVEDPDVFEQARAAVVDRLRESEWAEECGFAEWFLLTRDIDEFNAALNNLYDRADDDRVWICTF